MVMFFIFDESKKNEMKSKIIFCAIFTFQFIAGFAQDMESLKSEALKSYKAAVTMDFPAIFDTTYPKLFDITSKDEMKQMLPEVLENEQYILKYVEVDPEFNVGKITKINDKTFCVIKHKNVYTMTFKNPVEDVKEMTDSFKSIMKADSMKFDKATNSFRVESQSIMVGIADDVTNNKWKFLTVDRDNVLFPMIFSANIQKELGF